MFDENEIKQLIDTDEDGMHITNMINIFFELYKDNGQFPEDKIRKALKIHAEFIGPEEFEKMVSSPSFSARALKLINKSDTKKPLSSLTKGLILFDPILMEEYMNRNMRQYKRQSPECYIASGKTILDEN